MRRLIHLKTQHLGPDELLVGAKLEFAPDLSVDELAEAINGAEKALREAVPIARVVYIEPDVYRPAVAEFVHDRRHRDHARRHRIAADRRLVGIALRARGRPRVLEQLVDRQVGRRARLGGRVLADDRRGGAVVARDRRPARR